MAYFLSRYQLNADLLLREEMRGSRILDRRAFCSSHFAKALRLAFLDIIEGLLQCVKYSALRPVFSIFETYL